jgi:hypothetical protein
MQRQREPESECVSQLAGKGTPQESGEHRANNRGHADEDDQQCVQYVEEGEEEEEEEEEDNDEGRRVGEG